MRTHASLGKTKSESCECNTWKMETVVVIFVALLALSDSCSFKEGEIVDLTHPFDDKTIGYPGLTDFKLEVQQNGTTNDGYWLQIEGYESSIHTGTHMDAPCHIKKGQWTLDQIPIERFIGPAAVVDICHRTRKNRDANLEVSDLVRWERVTGKTLNGTIVLVNTGWGKKWPDKEAFLGTSSNDVSKVHFPGISPAAARWLATKRTPYGIGIDTTSLDNGQATHRKAHEALFSANIYGLENVANVHKLPIYGAKLYVFPMKITHASGAPARIIAILPKKT